MSTELATRKDVEDWTRIEELDALHTEISELKTDLATARREAMTVKRETAQALGALRKQLSPLYRALQAVFGELESVGISDVDGVAAPTARTSAVWEQWKQKLDKGCAKVIDALLIHGEMTRRQIAIATGYSPQNISNVVSRLNQASLITKNGDRIALRSL